MSASLPASAAIVVASRWRSEKGDARTTIAAKVTAQLADDSKAALVAPEPLVEFDRIAPDGRHVLEAGELAPWTSVASVVAYGGPLRFTLETEAGEPLIVVTASAKSPAGYSMSSAERSAFAPQRPARSADGVLTIPEGVDGRYFVAAPKVHQLASIQGDERFVLELAGWRCKRRLPAVAVIATVTIGGRERRVALTPDMVIIHGGARRLSMIARAVVRGDATLVAHAVAPIAGITTHDRGDAPFGKNAPAVLFEETSDGTGAVSRDAAPFALDQPGAEADKGRLAHEVPATPFDPGFAPAPVVPGVGLLQTLKADDDLGAKLKDLRAALRAQPPAPLPAPPAPRSAGSTGTPEVAPPKPGAMAKPRLKRR